MYRYCSTKLDTNAVKLPSVRRESTNHFPKEILQTSYLNERFDQLYMAMGRYRNTPQATGSRVMS